MAAISPILFAPDCMYLGDKHPEFGNSKFSVGLNGNLSTSIQHQDSQMFMLHRDKAFYIYTPESLNNTSQQLLFSLNASCIFIQLHTFKCTSD